ncbi:MAG: decarboxylating NADP(+)-dependent phosphogluconate dehydrogenase [Chitinispirillaceae bacterium]|nr:decarboxylating NADP(+)-dependent phosphogluconate dehydrogenase [Chitinispirillaceae bacterium]
MGVSRHPAYRNTITRSCQVENKGDIGMVGLAVMGQNLILNMDDHGYGVVAYNRDDEFVGNIDKVVNMGKKVLGVRTIEEMMGKLKTPRKIMIMVQAGKAIDQIIEQLLPHCSPGDCIIDGGNSHFTDTIRRTSYLEEKGLLYVGTGVSGGEEGARHGPSMMPGGSPKAWPLVKDIFQAIAAKTPNNVPCCDWVGDNGAGHYVKMAHNAIEYGDMQIICEAYALLKNGLRLSADAMHDIFATWNKTELDSYLIEITAGILAFKDDDGTPLVEKILDKAGQKGTGKWFSVNSLDLGIPVTLIAEAVYARCLSAIKEERVAASKKLGGPGGKISGDAKTFVEDIRLALLASKIISYAQGFMCLREAAKEYQWRLDYGAIAMLWRSGCIIRSVFLENIKNAYAKNPELSNLLMDDYFKAMIDRCQPSWRRVVSQAALSGVPVPAFSSALAFYDGYRSAQLPANLLQAQRDYFGAHTYKRIDKTGDKTFHTNWTGHGGDVASGSYTV